MSYSQLAREGELNFLVPAALKKLQLTMHGRKTSVPIQVYYLNGASFQTITSLFYLILFTQNTFNILYTFSTQSFYLTALG